MFSEIEGFIFDLDDTIVETEQLNVELISKYFQKVWGIRLDDADKNIVFGHSWQYIYEFIINKYNLPLSIQDVQNSIIEMKRDHLRQNTLHVARGVELLCGLPVKKVIVSGSGKEEIEMVLENINLSHCFHHSFSSDDYEKGKPHPDGFLAALNYLNLAGHKVLAFEDATSGIEAAKKAGIIAVFINEFAKDDCSHIADFSFQDFEVFYKQFIKSFKA